MSNEISNKLDELHDIVIAMKKCMDKLETIKPINYYENETKEILQQIAKEQVKVTVLLGHMVKQLNDKISKLTESQNRKDTKKKRNN